MPSRSITAVGVATGIPRETVRRLLARLAATDWLEVAAPTGYITSGQTREWFGQTQAPGVLCEFVRVAPDRALAIDTANVRARSAAIDAETLADMLETYETLSAFGKSARTTASSAVLWDRKRLDLIE